MDKTRESLVAVTTLLTPDERVRVDAAGTGIYRAVHRQNLHEIARDLRLHQATAVLLSTSRCEYPVLSHVARMVREFPRVPAVAVMSQFTRQSAHAVLLLGQCGVRTLVDVRDSHGWRELRNILASDRTVEVRRAALATLGADLSGAPTGTWQFFQVLFEKAPDITTIRELAHVLGVVPSTLMSRFFRAQLPPPKKYLAWARLTCAAYLFEMGGLSVGAVANQLEYSSPQSFGRHIRALMKMSATEFRDRYDGDGMLHRFREELVLPYLPTLRVFDPLTGP